MNPLEHRFKTLQSKVISDSYQILVFEETDNDINPL